MNRFAALLDRLAYERGRLGKLADSGFQFSIALMLIAFKPLQIADIPRQAHQAHHKRDQTPNNRQAAGVLYGESGQ